MKDKQQDKPVSAEKLAANRKNAMRSTGYPDHQGEAAGFSRNAYKHGFYATRTFATKQAHMLREMQFKDRRLAQPLCTR